MTKTDCRLCVVVSVLLSHTPSLFSQNLKSFNQNASRSNHTRLSLAVPEQAFVLRLNGDRVSSSSDGLASGGSFIPGISAHYYMGSWGLGAEYTSFTSSPQFDIAAYLKNMQGFAARDIVSSEWRTRSLLAGISYRASLGGGLYATADVFGGMVRIKSPSYSITDKTDGTLIADMYYQTKTTTSADKPLFGVKPSLRLEWFPGSGAIGLHIHASYMQITGASEVSAYYRDLSKVRFENASQQEIRAQVLNAPVIESRSKGPVSNLAFGAGVTLRIAPRTTPRQTQGATFGEKVSAGMKSYPVHRDVAMRNIITGRLAFQLGSDGLGIITNESNTSDTSLGRENAIPILSFNAATLTAREAGSGMATGRRDNNPDTPIVAFHVNPLYTGSGTSGSNPLHKGNDRVANNPLYTGSGTSGSNPLHKGNDRVANNPLYTGSGTTGQNPLSQGIAAVDILLVDAATGEVLATTRTEQGGDFFFANVPDGKYLVKVAGGVTFQNGYDLYARKDADVAGVIRQGISQVVLSLATGTGSLSNRVSQPVHTYTAGESPASSQAARPGNPIGGIIVKGGKNPGGSFFTTTTDNNGRFEFNGLKEGNYTLIFQQTIYFSDEVPVALLD